MSPDQFAGLRKFLDCVEPKLPQAVAIMYCRLLEAMPEARHLFKGDLQEQQTRYHAILREIVKLTRSCHLWPVRAFEGTASIPAIDRLGSFHSCLGVTQEHYGKMTTVLVGCFKEYCPEEFTPDAEEALAFIFDVLAKASTGACMIRPEELAHKNKLRHFDGVIEAGSLAAFLGGEALNEAP
jgi:hemoglobin-like flavoprotein